MILEIIVIIIVFITCQWLFNDVHMRVQDIFCSVMIILTIFITLTAMGLVTYLNTMDGISTKSSNPCVKGLMNGSLDECVGNATTKKLTGMMKETQKDWSNIYDEYSKKSSELVNINNKLSINMKFNFKNMFELKGQIMVIATQIQIMMAKLYDSFNRIMGSVTSLSYLLNTGIITAKGIVFGEIGDHVRTMMEWGFCFHPDTKIPLRNGECKCIKHIQVGDILKNGSEVMGTVNVRGNLNDTIDNKNPYYSIYSRELKENIYVTGSHKMRMKGMNDNTVTEVKNCPYAKIEPNIKTKYFKCLITHDHLIQIGEHTFYDWEY